MTSSQIAQTQDVPAGLMVCLAGEPGLGKATLVWSMRLTGEPDVGG
jgi:hypothetical protein